LLGLAALVYTFFSWVTGSTVPGWTSLAAIVLIMGSVQLFVLGIFGEYLGRMYMESKRRPLYNINEISRTAGLPDSQELPVHRLQEMAREARRG
jgi:dolichol-phosphate mannosyltransferase